MDDFTYLWFGLIGSMVVFLSCCIVLYDMIGMICCKSDGGRNDENASGTNAAARYRSTGKFVSYGGGFGGYFDNGISDGGCGGESGGCGGNAGACGV